MKSDAKTVEQYLDGLPEDRREAIAAVRRVIRKNLPKGYEEGMQYGMIGYYVPHSLYPAGYHCDPKQPVPFASIASQKNHMAIYMMCIYSDPAHLEWFVDAWEKSGNRLDMGKGCVRFRKLENVPLDVVGEAIKRVPVKQFLEHYESTLRGMASRRPSAKKKPAAKKAPSKKAASKKTAKKPTKKTVAKKTSKKAASKKRVAKKKSSR